MSKGGAGKVYFVLYLAVILELLIIFIERDEAEEGLRKQQQQAIEIVQTILSQLQTGTGATGITASPKDNIVLSDKDPASTVRNYTVMVAVGDPKAQNPGSDIRGDDISKLEYIVSHTSDPNLEEVKLGPDSADIEGGNIIFKAELGKDVGSYTDPKQTYGSSIPADVTDKYFTLNEELTNEQISKGRRVKVFSVNFKPNQGPGWYRLRFTSATNKILGVTREPTDNDTVRIGNVRLSVKQLRQVQKVLRKERAGGEPSQVETYVDQLLTPDAYKTLAENQGFTSFNVHVVRPELPPPAQPFASISASRDTIYWLDAAPFSIPVTLGPKEASREVSGGARLVEADANRNLYNATIEQPQPGTVQLTAKAFNAGMQAVDEKVLVVEKPMLRQARFDKNNPTQMIASGIDQWRGLSATIGVPYDPSSEWQNPAIPADHYQTVVAIKGTEVLNRPGVTFKNLPQEVQKALTITDGTKPDDIVTRVYWKPGGTGDRARWVLLMSNQSDPAAVVQLEKRKMTVSYRKPEIIADQYDFIVGMSSKNKSTKSPTFQAIQRIGQSDYPVSVQYDCPDCNAAGLVVTLEQDSDREWHFVVSTNDFTKLLKNQAQYNGKKFDIDMTLTGKGDPKKELMSFTLTIQR